MKWQFTIPNAPHQSGCSDAMVKKVKKALKKAIGDTVLTPFELYTCLLEIANLVNQQPIGRIPNDPIDGAYLCPNDILLRFLSQHQFITIRLGGFRTRSSCAREPLDFVYRRSRFNIDISDYNTEEGISPKRLLIFSFLTLTKSSNFKFLYFV